MLLHRVIRKLATWSVWSFYRDIHVVGEENIPRDGPVIVVCTHHNMLIDPAVLSATFPHKRPLHYWSKSSLFKNPIVGWILTDTGNIPVDRKSKDNQVLFKGTFEVLAQGEVVALFPEGTSYTEPRIMQVKDGASWSALEFAKWARVHGNETHGKPLVVVPAAIVYTDKAKYRSGVIVEFGKPFTMKQFENDFLSDEPGATKSAVKRLTARIEREMVMLTINSPDWETLYAARTARDLLWQRDTAINPDDFVAVSQTLVDLFCTPVSSLPSSFPALRRALITYQSLLRSTNLTNATLSGLPLPDTLNPNLTTPFPSRLTTIFVLMRDSFASLVRLPFFLIPLLVHLPAYGMARMGARLAEDEEETQAQNKVVFALLLLLAIYPAMFFFLWAFFYMTPTGGVIALATSYAFVYYHIKIVDSNYEHAKRLVAAWRVLCGVWIPKRWDLSITALTPYTTPYIPPVSLFIDKPKPTSSTTPPPTTPPKRRRKEIPTHRLIRHVLRARSDAARLLAAFFADLERSGGPVRASSHLAARFGAGRADNVVMYGTKEGVVESVGPTGWRDAREVVRFLRERGARIHEIDETVGGDWAAASNSEGEIDTPMEEEELVWVPPGTKRE
ncbi:hypothetical protein M422DRAFT_224945 [Sphaerobolus stellatus SS14]|nr:hypothetical protein M422DRAFT_224945 [Sphaerobolus stellatus SS14]